MKTQKTTNSANSTTIALIFTALMLFSLISRAENAPQEVYAVNGKNFTSKAMAIRYVVNLGKPVQVLHTRCEILTNKLTFKACPKNKDKKFENEQFQSLSQSE